MKRYTYHNFIYLMATLIGIDLTFDTIQTGELWIRFTTITQSENPTTFNLAVFLLICGTLLSFFMSLLFNHNKKKNNDD